MSTGFNHCTFIGRLGKEPEQKAMPSGETVVNFSLACGWKSKNGEGVEWVNCTAFGKLADVICQYLHKGSRIFVAGKMRTRRWEDKEGNTRHSTEIVVRDMQMLDSKADSQQAAAQAPQQASAGGGAMSDEVPFAQVDWRL